MSGRVVSADTTRRYNTDANVVNGLKNSSSYEPTGEKSFRNRRSLRRENQS